MHVAFLAAEFDKIDDTVSSDLALVTAPDLRDPAQNERRRELLYRRRERLLAYVPESTEWFEVRYLERHHLPQLRAINFGTWNSPGVDENELPRVAHRRRTPLLVSPSEWPPPILWGHTRAGPFTVLEGNNRLTAYAGATQPPTLHVRAVVGLSGDRCCWHLPDGR
jgi:hypothetical protein